MRVDGTPTYVTVGAYEYAARVGDFSYAYPIAMWIANLVATDAMNGDFDAEFTRNAGGGVNPRCVVATGEQGECKPINQVDGGHRSAVACKPRVCDT